MKDYNLLNVKIHIDIKNKHINSKKKIYLLIESQLTQKAQGIRESPFDNKQIIDSGKYPQ